jgi:DNA-damage-inducible protein D
VVEIDHFTPILYVEVRAVSKLNAEEYQSFEGIKKTSESGGEYWEARELAAVLEYTQWRNFAKVIDKARVACKNSGFDIDDHFAEVGKIVAAGATTKTVLDYSLTRYACYLIVQNGDPRKEVIALGQTYFAIQTRRQEVADYFNQLDEDNKRLVVRGEVKQWNKMLAEAAHNAGLITNEEYAVFQNAGYKGLYGGLDVADIHTRKGLAETDKILDFMGSEELAANLFRITQTESKMRRDNIQGADSANAAHYKVGKEVRASIERVGGTMPENLPTPEKSISEIERAEIRKLKKSKKPLMLDE